MTTAVTHDPATRPADLDARIMAYFPGLCKLAKKYRTRRADQYDLVVDTITHCLAHWKTFREDGGLYNWLEWNMLGVVSNQAQAAALRKGLTVIYDSDTLDFHASKRHSAASQFGAAMLAETLAAMPEGRDGAVLLRRAAGDTLHEVAEEFGISRQRVQQIEMRARERVAKKVGRG